MTDILASGDQIDSATWLAYRFELLQFVRSRVRDEPTAEDIVQEVLIRAYERQHTLRQSGNLRSWLFQITRNVIIDYYRARRPLDVLPDDLRAEDAASAREAEQHLAQCLAPLVRRLPERYRVAVELAELQGRSQKEISERLTISPSGARSRVQRGRKMLASMLMACCRLAFDTRGRPIDYERQGDCSGCGTC